jgi:hypothetical protein
MKKVLTLLFAFTCLAFSEMRGQAGPIGLRININNCQNPSLFQSVVLFTEDSVNYYSLITLLDTSYYINFEFSPRGNYDDFGYPGYQWFGAVNTLPDGISISDGSIGCITIIPGRYFLSFNRNTKAYNFSNTGCRNSPEDISPSQVIQVANSPLSQCDNIQLFCVPSYKASNWSYQWKKDGIDIVGANDFKYSAPASIQNSVYSCTLTCPDTSFSVSSNSIVKQACFNDVSSSINYLLVQNVTTTGNNATNKTIQVQFDLSWGNTWWDDINWDAAWVFMKYKTASGEWKHAKINPTGYDKGQGSPNIIQPTSDKMGAFVRLGLKGQGNFNAEGMQLQWNYGLDGLSSVNGLEVKVFAIEMVYQPQGDFTLSTDFTPGAISAPAGNIAVVNNRLSPVLTGNFKIKGDAGLDLNADGTIDNTTFPTGYKPFYVFKYEMSEQAYADFLNCLSASQVSNIGIAGTSISLSQGQYFAAAPNRACKGAESSNLLAYADWSSLRPISVFELHKAWNGPNSPNGNGGKGSCYCVVETPEDASGNQGAGLFGSKDLIGNVWEPFINIQSTSFSDQNGDGVLASDGNGNQPSWSNLSISWGNFNINSADCQSCSQRGYGFRLGRSAE